MEIKRNTNPLLENIRTVIAIGIILCKEENRTVVEFTLPEKNEQIFAKEYKAVLPSKEALKKQLE